MTVHSDWGDWLPTAVADAEPDGVQLWYLGCNGFVLKADDGTTVFIDPYLGLGDPPRTVRMIPVPFDPTDVVEADAVLATHEHTDHVHGPSQAPILEDTDATFYGPSASVETAREWTTDYDLTDDDFTEIEEGDTVEVGSLEIAVEPAHDPDADHPVSYVIRHEAGTFFHGGDARPSEAFESVGERYDIDLGVLAFGSAGMIPDKQTREPKYTKWYSDENMAAEAAAQLQLDRLLPTHWDMWKGLTADPEALRHHVRSFAFPRTLEVLEIGDDTTL
ncbi:MBL fold metallo-hydrolase [Natronomonas sp. CBA1123]|uniref:MBL fold metallo-hydrolase n=1 Tax=Natronomonas sp. CBA1123 TaxID=2668070 RepID=UPI0012EABC8D|nr:MBL fold metallo-hydrolase [Natronomonas sp. CBA1123]MUV88406.1 MBL fold metallo-hydrolase [Natronomonas sp. CBA1123]